MFIIFNLILGIKVKKIIRKLRSRFIFQMLIIVLRIIENPLMMYIKKKTIKFGISIPQNTVHTLK